MSHYTRVNTRIKNKDVLVAVLRKMGLSVQGDRVSGRTWVDAEIVETADGTYELAGDTFGMDVEAVRREAEEEMQRELLRQYALETSLASLKAQGFDVVEQVAEDDGRIRLVARRWD